MNIALFSVNAYYACDGIRLISALLKQAGHRVFCVSLPRHTPIEYESGELEQLRTVLQQCELVMIAVYSTYALRAVQITDYVRKNFPHIRVFWGGPHGIAAPENSLRHADGVCFSEGDECVVQCVDKMAAGDDSFVKTPNMAFRIDGSMSVNNVLPPFSDLDSLPFHDYDLKDQFILDGGMVPLTVELLRQYFPGYPFNRPTLAVLTSRGCPHQCAYCNNCRYVSLFGSNPIRRMSVGRFMDEVETTVSRLGCFEHILFGDDDFMIRPVAEIEEFAERYRRNVGLPFIICLSTTTFSKEKFEILLDSGNLRAVQLGIQSASQRVLDDIFERKISIQKTTEVIKSIAPYRATHSVDLVLDVIIDNPYETEEDILLTYRYLIDLPGHALVQIFRLVFFPGTPLYARAVKDEIVSPHDERSARLFETKYIKFQDNNPTFLILFFYALHKQRVSRFVPRRIFRILGSRALLALLRCAPKTLLLFLTRRTPAGVESLIIMAKRAFGKISPRKGRRERLTMHQLRVFDIDPTGKNS